MAKTVEKTVNFLGKDISLTIPSRQEFSDSWSGFSDSFDLGNNLVLHVSVTAKSDALMKKISTGISTKDGIAISRYETNFIPEKSAYDVLKMEMEGTVENIERDTEISQERHEQITESLGNVLDEIREEAKRNALHVGPEL